MIEDSDFMLFEHKGYGNCHHNSKNGAEQIKNCVGVRFVEKEAAHPASNAANEHQWVCPGKIADEIFIECTTYSTQCEEYEQCANLTY